MQKIRQLKDKAQQTCDSAQLAKFFNPFYEESEAVHTTVPKTANNGPTGDLLQKSDGEINVRLSGMTDGEESAKYYPVKESYITD